jgi:uncharacterized protein with von Willebrand factor type A (vWA) domain
MESNPFALKFNTRALCQRCMMAGSEEGQALAEVGIDPKRDAEELLEDVKDDKMPGLKRKAGRMSRQRLEQEKQQLLEDIKEKVGRPDVLQDMEEQIEELGYQEEDEINADDLQGCLDDFIEDGYLDKENGEVKMTSRGARKLGGYLLSVIVKKLVARAMGTHQSRRADYGSRLFSTTRKYELGDEYHRIDIEGTFLNALERSHSPGGVSLEPGDLSVYDEMHESKMCAGLIIDESGSMDGPKISAAMATALALAELIRREPKDLLKVYLFSSEVKEIPYYDVVNAVKCNQSTDILSALKAFRKGVSGETGDKQAYLITDAEANTESGRSVGFAEASEGLIREALYYRQAGITLNIVLLDESPHLQEFATRLAERNLGRVIFSSPEKLGESLIRDYLASKEKNYIN